MLGRSSRNFLLRTPAVGWLTMPHGRGIPFFGYVVRVVALLRSSIHTPPRILWETKTI